MNGSLFGLAFTAGMWHRTLRFSDAEALPTSSGRPQPAVEHRYTAGPRTGRSKARRR